MSKVKPASYKMQCPFTGCRGVGRRGWGNYCIKHQDRRTLFRARLDDNRCPYHNIPLAQLEGNLVGCPRRDCEVAKVLTSAAIAERMKNAAVAAAAASATDITMADDTQIAVTYPGDGNVELIVRVFLGLPAALTFIENDLTSGQQADAQIWKQFGRLRFVAQFTATE